MSATSPCPHIDFDSDSIKLKLKVEFPADVKHLSGVVDGIMRVVVAMQCACGEEHEVDLVLREALANAITHGAGNDPNKRVACCVGCEDERGMIIVVSDPGEGFDLTKVADPLHGDNLYSSHGRGIFLINRLMDEVEYKRGGCEIHMRKFPKATVDKKTCGLS